MNLETRQARFLRQLQYWSRHCAINALPSLAIALFWLRMWRSAEAVGAMLAAILTFVLLYSVLTSSFGPLSDSEHPVHRAMRLGTKIRAWISWISLILVPMGALVMFTPDFWCGWLAVESLNFVGKAAGGGGEFFNPGTTTEFGRVYVTTLLEGFILSALLMVISFFCVIFIQSRDRRKAYGAGVLTGGNNV